MNRYTSLLSILSAGCCIALAGCTDNLQTKDLERFGLSGAIESVKTTVLQGDNYMDNYLAEFSPKGLLTSVTNFAPDSTILFSTTYRHDNKGRLTGITECDMDGDENGEYRYTYDGKFLSLCTHIGESSEEDCRWEHENDGKHITRTVFYSDGVLETISENSWEGMTRHETVKTQEDSLIGTAEYVYLKEDKPVSITSNDTAISIEYNEKGLPVKSVNALISTDGNLAWDPMMVQDEENIYEYEYDTQGNWIRRKEYIGKNKILRSDISRTITYR